jgi:hypothetical protein
MSFFSNSLMRYLILSSSWLRAVSDRKCAMMKPTIVRVAGTTIAQIAIFWFLDNLVRLTVLGMSTPQYIELSRHQVY